MILLKLALLTCAFYIAIVALMELAIFLSGDFGIAAKPWGWTVLFGIIWLVSFTLAWHIFRAKILSPIFHS